MAVCVVDDGVASFRSAGVRLTPGLKSLLFAGDEPTTPPSVQPFGPYAAFPAIVIAANGDLVCVHRRANAHGPSPTTCTLRANVSSDKGVTWEYSRLDEPEIEDNPAEDVYSPALRLMTMGSIAGQIWLTYERDTATGPPYRQVFLRISTDNGASFGPAQLIPDVGDRYTSACGAPIQISDEVVILPVYWRNVSGMGHPVGTVNGYHTTLMRTTNASAATPTWVEYSLIAGDPVVAYQYEETQLCQLDDGRLLALIRVDSVDPPGGSPNSTSTIFKTYSDDDGLTWTPVEPAFRGGGWPAVIQMTNGILVAMTRDPYGFERELAPMFWTSSNRGDTWQGPTEFGDTRLIPGLGTFPGGYMYGQFCEPEPNVVGVMFAQEHADFGRTYLTYQEYGVNAQPTIPYRYSQCAHFDATSSDTDYISYPSNDLFDGATELTAFIRMRLPVNPANNTEFFSRHVSLASSLYRWYWATTRRFYVGLGVGGSTAWCGSPVDSILFGVNYSFMWTFNGGNVGDANRFKMFVNGVQQTVTFSGVSVPASLNSPAAQPWNLMGLSGPSASARGLWAQDLAVWGSDESANAVALHNKSVPFDFASSPAGAPDIWMPFDGDFNDVMGTLGAPTIEGENYTFDDIYTFGPGYLGTL